MATPQATATQATPSMEDILAEVGVTSSGTELTTIDQIQAAMKNAVSGKSLLVIKGKGSLEKYTGVHDFVLVDYNVALVLRSGPALAYFEVNGNAGDYETSPHFGLIRGQSALTAGVIPLADQKGALIRVKQSDLNCTILDITMDDGYRAFQVPYEPPRY